jgi:O-acetyl-ADP-ribose deacetylase (regulator of RNase III)
VVAGEVRAKGKSPWRRHEKMEKKIGSVTVRLVAGDITQRPVEALVNAANNHLWMGAGVAGAIKRKGGEEIEREAVAKGPVQVGEAVVTSAGRLKSARYVIHAAVMGQDLRTTAEDIRAATSNALARAKELGLKSITFPALGTGVGGFPLRECARIMLGAAAEHVNTGTSLKVVEFALFGEEALRAFEEEVGGS